MGYSVNKSDLGEKSVKTHKKVEKCSRDTSDQNIIECADNWIDIAALVPLSGTYVNNKRTIFCQYNLR